MSATDVMSEVIPQYLIDPPLSDKVQIMYNNYKGEIKYRYFSQSLPVRGIIRKIEQKNSLEEINSTYSKDQLIYSNAEKIFVASVEIENLTLSFEGLQCNEFSKTEFFCDLPQIVLNSSLLNGRVPKIHEVVVLGYEREGDFSSVEFKGFPYNETLMDPNLQLYATKCKPGQTAKSAFQSGSGIMK